MMKKTWKMESSTKTQGSSTQSATVRHKVTSRMTALTSRDSSVVRLLDRFGSPNDEHLSVVDKTDHTDHQQHEHVADDLGRSHGKSARHTLLIISFSR